MFGEAMPQHCLVAPETRYCEVRAEGRRLSGVAVRYGDVARMPWGLERIEAGAFDIGDVVLNVQHDRGRIIARTPQTLRLRDGPDELRVAAELPATREADDTLALVRAGVLQGLSIEFQCDGDRMEGNTRVIERGKLVGCAVVDRPAYPASAVAARARQEGLSASFKYDRTRTVRDRGKVRKEKVMPGAFDYGLAEPEREVTLQIGRDPGKVVASKTAGNLKIENTRTELRVAVPRVPDTTYVRDLLAQLRDGFRVGLTPLYRVPPASVVRDAVRLVAEAGNPGVYIREIWQAILFALAIDLRPAFEEPDVAERQRKPLWL